MMYDVPLKFRILEVLEEEPMWNYEIAEMLVTEFDMDNRLGRDSVNYDCIESVSAGFCKETDWDVDIDGSRFDSTRPGRLLTKYELTGYGKETLDELKKKVRHYTPNKEQVAVTE